MQALVGSSVVAMSYGPEEQPIGALAVIGPMRMNYGKVMSVVDFTADTVSSCSPTCLPSPRKRGGSWLWCGLYERVTKVGSRRRQSSGADASGVIPVEVEPPDRRPTRRPIAVAALEAKLAAPRRRRRTTGTATCARPPTSRTRASASKRELDDAQARHQEQGAQGDAAGRRQPRARDRARESRRPTATASRSSRACSSCCASSQTAFERLDVTPVDALGQPFDPNLHEAISQQESDQPPGHGRAGAAARLQAPAIACCARRSSSSRRRRPRPDGT